MQLLFWLLINTTECSEDLLSISTLIGSKNDVDDARLRVVHLPSFRCESPLPHDLYQRQVQSEYWTTGVFLCHLGPPGDHVRHAGSGEDTSGHRHTRSLLQVCHFDWSVCVCVCCSMSQRSCLFQTQRGASLCLMTSSRRWKKVSDDGVCF